MISLWDLNTSSEFSMNFFCSIEYESTLVKVKTMLRDSFLHLA